MDDIATWVRQNREDLGWSAAQLAERARIRARDRGDRIQLTQQSISGLENGRLKKKPYWLRYVEEAIEEGGSDYRRDEVTSLSAADHAREIDAVLVPHYGSWLSMGGGTVVSEPAILEYFSFSRSWLRGRIRGMPEDVVLLNGEGDSMEPTIRDGDVLLVDRSQRNVQSDKIYAIAVGDTGMVKRLRKERGGGYTILSDNSLVPPDHANDGEMEVLGRVIWIGRWS